MNCTDDFLDRYVALSKRAEEYKAGYKLAQADAGRLRQIIADDAKSAERARTKLEAEVLVERKAREIAEAMVEQLQAEMKAIRLAFREYKRG